MSVWLMQVLSFRIGDSRAGAVWSPQGALLRPPFWLLLAGIIVIGIVLGLFATNVAAILLSSSTTQAANSAGGCGLTHLRTSSASIGGLQIDEITQLCGVGHGNFEQGGQYDEF